MKKRHMQCSMWMAAVCVLVLSGLIGAPRALGEDNTLHIIVFGAHPDDCELKSSGVAAKWTALGHKVKFVSTTNGDIGHYEMAGGPLAIRRTAEVKAADDILGVESEVLDIHDGELMPTLENRLTFIRLIREWKADVVIGPRPNDYHPDHRYTGILLQDASFMVTVPFICPDTPRLTKNPLFLYVDDRFQKPYPFEADIVVDIGDVIDKKIAACSELKSQFLEWNPWLSGYLDQVPKAEAEQMAWLREKWIARFSQPAKQYRDRLEHWYGAKAAKDVKYAEAFEVTEYGMQPTEDQIRELFPFLPAKKAKP